MKKHFYSIWFRVVLAYFWTLVFTGIIIGFTVHLANYFNLWSLLTFPVVSAHFIILLVVVSIIVGTLISIFASHHVMIPVSELSNAINQVANGDYSVRLDTGRCKAKGELYDVMMDFNYMVQELASTEMLHSDFISNVSHEFKTPLATITGYATLLQDDSLTPDERNEYIGTIIQSAKELSHMTGNILQLSHLENQIIISDQEYFRLDEQIRQIILRLEPLWSEKNLVLTPELDTITWYGNQELTAHIWKNLLDNAIKFTPQGGEILITACQDAEWVIVTVEDSGPGMTSEVQTHIFDKFYQGDTSHKKKGNGLGLALVRRIVTLYNGRIEVESQPNLGSSFKIYLPFFASGQTEALSSL